MSLKKNVVANYFGAGWNALMALAFVPLYIKYLGMEAYGLIGIFAMLQGWLALLDMGMSPALSREMARFTGGGNEVQSIRNLLRSIEIIAVSVALLSVLAVWLGSAWLASGWLKAEKLPLSVVSQALVIMGWVVGLRFIENIYRSSIVGLQRQVILNVLSSIMSTLRGLGAVGILIFISPTIHAYFVWQGIISFVTVGLLAGLVYWVLPAAPARVVFSIKALKTIWQFALGTVVLTLLSLLLTQVDKILLSRLLTLTAFGYYVFAVGVAQMPFIAVSPVTQAFYPRFTQLYQGGNKAGLVASYHTSAQLITVLLGSATVILIFFGNDILKLWTRNSALAESSYALVAVLSFGSLLNGLMTIPYNLQLSTGWTGLMIRVNLAVISVIVPTLFWVVPRYGALGAAWVWVIVNAGYVFVAIQLMHQRLLPEEKWNWYLWDVAAPLSAAAVTAILFRLLIPDFQGLALKVAKLGICFFMVSLSAVLTAPMVRRHMLKYLPVCITLQ